MATKKNQTTPNLYAVIGLNGKQYLVNSGQTLLVDKLEGKEGESLTLKDVLLVINGEDTLVGTPNLDGVSVTVSLDKVVKGEKIEVRKFRAKSRYRRHTGHRPVYSQITVSAINLK